GLREGPCLDAVLEVEDTERRIGADRGAEDGFDAVRLDALARLKAWVVDRRGRHDRAPRRDGLADHTTRDRRARLLEIRFGEALGDRPASVAVVMKLDVAPVSGARAEDERERFAEEGLERVVRPQVEELPVEVALGSKRFAFDYFGRHMSSGRCRVRQERADGRPRVAVRDGRGW